MSAPEITNTPSTATTVQTVFVLTSTSCGVAQVSRGEQQKHIRHNKRCYVISLNHNADLPRLPEVWSRYQSQRKVKKIHLPHFDLKKNSFKKKLKEGEGDEHPIPIFPVCVVSV